MVFTLIYNVVIDQNLMPKTDDANRFLKNDAQHSKRLPGISIWLTCHFEHNIYFPSNNRGVRVVLRAENVDKHNILKCIVLKFKMVPLQSKMAVG